MTDDRQLVWVEVGREDRWDGRSFLLTVPGGRGSIFVPSSDLVVADGKVWWLIDEALAEEFRAAVNDDR